MNKPRRIAVIDIGKTNAKVAMVDAEPHRETGVRKTPNAVLRGGPYPHFDMEGNWAFILGSLRDFYAEEPFDAISITTHGASGTLVNADGSLALPALDYEYDGPDTLADEYDKVCPPFSETFSPRLRNGLNLGAQVFWQQKSFPNEFAAAAHYLTQPQYWAMRLTGVAASEATSLGSHTDLWQPAKADFSSLVTGQGWRGLFPPLRSAFDVPGPLKAEIAGRLGIKKPIPVSCGVHDSNASLLPHLLARKPPFSVVSTGTWVIIFSAGADLAKLDPSRDCLANVDAFASPVASARFMGGREYEMIVPPGVSGNDASLQEVLDKTILLLPSVDRTSGPFQGMTSAWQPCEPQGRARASAASLYLAMMTAASLELSGGAGDIIVEGPFARNSAFLEMLTVAAGRAVIAMAGSSTGTSLGAALLALGRDHVFAMEAGEAAVPAAETRVAMERWRDAWKAAVARRC